MSLSGVNDRITIEEVTVPGHINNITQSSYLLQ